MGYTIAFLLGVAFGAVSIVVIALADNGYTIDDLDTIFGKVNEEVNADGDGD